MRSTTPLPFLLLAALAVGCSSCDTGDGVEDAASAGVSAPPAAPVAAGESADYPRPAPRVVDEERIASLRATVDDRPEDADARLQLADALREAMRLEEARVHFERAAELRPDPRSLLALALFYGASSRLGEAEEVYGKLLELAPDHPVALHNLGNLALRRDEPEQALAYYDRALRAEPAYLLARYHRAEALKRAGRFQESFRAFESVFELEPKNARELEAFDDALYQMASLHLTMGADEAARPMLEEVLRANPDHPSANYAYGQVLLRLGKPQEAQAAFQNHMRVLAAQEPSGPAAAGD